MSSCDTCNACGNVKKADYLAKFNSLVADKYAKSVLTVSLKDCPEYIDLAKSYAGLDKSSADYNSQKESLSVKLEAVKNKFISNARKEFVAGQAGKAAEPVTLVTLANMAVSISTAVSGGADLDKVMTALKKAGRLNDAQAELVVLTVKNDLL